VVQGVVWKWDTGPDEDLFALKIDLHAITELMLKQ
jgi:hypothetical protein